MKNLSSSQKFTRQAFTLIEVLIVILVMWLLFAALTWRLQSNIVIARDTKRKLDLNTINAWIQTYRNDHGVYPLAKTDRTTPPWMWCTSYGDCGVYSWYPSDQVKHRIWPLWGAYMTTVPKDPINVYFNSPWMSWMTYFYWQVYTGITTIPGKEWEYFWLSTTLESPSDRSRCQFTNANNITGDDQIDIFGNAFQCTWSNPTINPGMYSITHK